MKNTSNVSRLKSDLILGALLLLIGIPGVFSFYDIYFLTYHCTQDLLSIGEKGVTHRVEVRGHVDLCLRTARRTCLQTFCKIEQDQKA